MAELIRETEAAPVRYPTIALLDGLEIDLIAIWPRVEAWCNYRWSPRDVVWIVEGCGHWTPPLSPVVTLKAEIWSGGVWRDVTPDPSPYGGYEFGAGGPYRVTAKVGAAPVPAAVQEAMRRLAKYLDDDMAPAGATHYRVDMAETIEEEISRSGTHMARALQYSGAADLLRPWRRRK